MKRPETQSRRKFLGRAGRATAVTVAANAIGLPAVSLFTTSNVKAAIGPDDASQRRVQAKQVRDRATQAEFAISPQAHPDNGDEARYPNRIGNFSKTLKHDPLTGEVDPAAYNALLTAIASGKNADFEALAVNGHFGSSDPSRQRRLVNPQAGYAFDLQGSDSHVAALRPAPAFASAEEAGEMAELYWMALLRDANFEDYASNAIAFAAAADLSNMSDFRGPKQGGSVTTQTLFRDLFPGCTTGPYISQFLLQPAAFGAQRVDQRIRTNAPNIDFVTTFAEWLDTQNGVNNTTTLTPGALVFCRNGRDLAQYVHIDVLFQAYFVAFLILAGGGYPLDSGNPYGVVLDGGAGRPRNALLDPNGSLSQTGFGTFGAPSMATLVAEPSSRALKHVWYQKWLVHRRLRPEEFGGRVEVQRLGRASYPIHQDLTTTSTVLNLIFSKFGSYLLPLAFPEGSPNHTSYGSGHSTVAGACVTMLKAFFDESAPIQNPVVPDATGTTLVPYTGPTLTVGGELNKLASNVAQGRNIAGVHWRTDATESIKLGEQCAIDIFRDQKSCYNETFSGFSLTKFDGSTVTV
jgi:membrane-associated phospholipid phosphatase